MKCIYMSKVFNQCDDNIVHGMDICQCDTRNKEYLRKTKSVTDKGLLRSINVVTDCKLPILVDFISYLVYPYCTLVLLVHCILTYLLFRTTELY